MGKLWQIDGQSPNSPMFSPANVLRYTVIFRYSYIGTIGVTLKFICTACINLILHTLQIDIYIAKYSYQALRWMRNISY